VKILTVHPGPEFSVADVHRGYHRALVGLGCQVVDIAYHERLSFYSNAGRMTADGSFVRMVDEVGAVRLAAKGIEAACYEFRPDVVLVVSGFFVPLDTLDVIRSHGTKVVLMHTESPYEDVRQLVRAAHADLNVLNDPTNIDRFAELGAAVYLPHAYDPTVHHPGPAWPDHHCDFCFVGTGYPSRVEFFEAVDFTGVDVALAGNWQHLAEASPLRKFVAHDVDDCCDNDEAAALYRGAKLGANLYRRDAERPELADGWSMGPREVEMAACGLAFLRESRGEGDDVLPMLPTFDGPGDFAEKLRWWLAHDDQRRSVAAQARDAVAGRTFTANAVALLTALDALPASYLV